MGTYYAAQLGIALSVLDERITQPTIEKSVQIGTLGNTQPKENCNCKQTD